MVFFSEAIGYAPGTGNRENGFTKEKKNKHRASTLPGSRLQKPARAFACECASESVYAWVFSNLPEPRSEGGVGWWARKTATTQTTPTRTQDAGLTSQCPPTTSLPRRPMGVSGSRRPGSEPGHHRAEGKSVLCLSPIIYAAFVCAFTFYRDEYSRHRARCRVR